MSIICKEVFSKDELVAPRGYRYLDFIGGRKNYMMFLVKYNYPRNKFFIDYGHLLDEILSPVFDDGEIVIRQDASFPLPGFYILSFHRQFKNIIEIDKRLYLKAMELLQYTREGMKELLDIEYVHIYYEEKDKESCNVHFWVMPVDYRTRQVHNIFDIDQEQYLKSFDLADERYKIFKYNKMMRKYYKEISE
jgi:hypothetical protein